MTNTVNARCSPADQARGRPRLPLARSLVVAAMGINGLRHDAYVTDAGLLDCVHHGGEGAKGDVFVRAQVNRLMPGIANPLFQGGSDLVDVDGIVAEKNSLRFVDTDDQPLFGDLFDGAR